MAVVGVLCYSIDRSFIHRGWLLHDLEADTKLALLLVPVGAQEFEATYLRRGPHVLADAGADVIVADAHQADGLGGIGRQPSGRWSRSVNS